MTELITFFEPNVFSPVGTLVFVLVAALYWRGQRRLKAAGKPVTLWRAILFYTCWACAYVALETQFDYFAQFIFFMHRLQHLLLHHLLAFLLAVSMPWSVLNAGLGASFPRHFWLFVWLRAMVDWLMQPLVAAVLFVGLIAFWLYPPVHLAAMLNYPLYITMNWSMLVDGLLFWPMILDNRVAARVGASAYGVRLAALMFTLVGQVLIGASITFSEGGLYDIYTVCGRPWAIAPATDQLLGGLLTWIPPAMMAAIAALVVLGFYWRDEAQRQAALSPEQEKRA